MPFPTTEYQFRFPVHASLLGTDEHGEQPIFGWVIAIGTIRDGITLSGMWTDHAEAVEASKRINCTDACNWHEILPLFVAQQVMDKEIDQAIICGSSTPTPACIRETREQLESDDHADIERLQEIEALCVKTAAEKDEFMRALEGEEDFYAAKAKDPDPEIKASEDAELEAMEAFIFGTPVQGDPNAPNVGPVPAGPFQIAGLTETEGNLGEIVEAKLTRSEVEHVVRYWHDSYQGIQDLAAEGQSGSWERRMSLYSYYRVATLIPFCSESFQQWLKADHQRQEEERETIRRQLETLGDDDSRDRNQDPGSSRQ